MESLFSQSVPGSRSPNRAPTPEELMIRRVKMQGAVMAAWLAEETSIPRVDTDWAEPAEGYEKSGAMAFKLVYERHGASLPDRAEQDSALASAWLAKVNEVKARLERGESPFADGDSAYARAA